MEEQLKVNEEITIPSFELWFVASRSGGPGGQHVNKTSSRVTLYWNLSDTIALDAQKRARLMRRLGNRMSRDGLVLIHVDEARSQHRNRQVARERLVEMIIEALKTRKKRVPTAIPAGVHRRRVENKRRRSQVKRLRRNPAGDS